MYKNASYHRTYFLDSFEQMFSRDQPVKDMLHEDTAWTISFPTESSGPCYTYKPPAEADTGIQIGMYMTFKSDEFDEDLDIFLHEQKQFYYTKNPINDIHIDSKKLKDTKMNHPRAIGNI